MKKKSNDESCTNVCVMPFKKKEKKKERDCFFDSVIWMKYLRWVVKDFFKVFFIMIAFVSFFFFVLFFIFYIGLQVVNKERVRGR